MGRWGSRKAFDPTDVLMYIVHLRVVMTKRVQCSICFAVVNSKDAKTHLKNAHGLVKNPKKPQKQIKSESVIAQRIASQKLQVEKLKLKNTSYSKPNLLDGKRRVASLPLKRCCRCKKIRLNTWLYQGGVTEDVIVCNDCKLKVKGTSSKNMDAMLFAFRGGFIVKR